MRHPDDFFGNAGLNYLTLSSTSDFVKSLATFKILNNFIPRFHQTFYVMLHVTLGSLAATETFAIDQSDAFLIGVAFIQLKNRTISSSPVNQHRFPKIEIPECVERSRELQYEWEYEIEFHRGTCTRFGLELVVPRETVEYGLHRVHLTVLENTIDITKMQLIGSYVTILSVHGSAIVAMIGTV